MSREKQDFSEWLCRQQGVLPNSALRYTLSALVPHTKANLQLAFSPGRFFNELDKIDQAKYSRATIVKAYYEAKRRGLIRIRDDGSPELSEKAQQGIKPFQPKKLKGASVMVVFDIPELEARKRQWFRLLLRELKFEQIQKSVWTSEYDCFEVLSAGIIEQRLENYVRIFESRPVEL